MDRDPIHDDGSVVEAEKLADKTRLPQSVFTRNRLVSLLGAGVLGVVGYIGWNSINGSDSDSSLIHVENLPDATGNPDAIASDIVSMVEADIAVDIAESPTEIELGNIRFVLEDPQSITERERVELFANMREAYEKLVNYLGEEVMTYPHYQTVPLFVGEKHEGIHGEVGYDLNLQIDLGSSDNSDIHVSNEDPKSLKLNKGMSKSTIAHEFVHLFAQGPLFLSVVFREGQARAVANVLYPDNLLIGDAILLENKKVNNIFDEGFDSESFGNVGEESFNFLVQVRAAIEWGDFVQKHPDFFKIFYQKVKNQKTKNVAFSKDSLLEIAEQSAPGFRQWYKKTRSLHSVDEDGETKNLQAIWMPNPNVLVISNFIKKDVDLKPVYTGKVLLKVDDKFFVKEFKLEEINQMIFMVIPLWEFKPKNVEVTIGGKKIPVRQ